jgi:hypothetical protein
MFFKNIISITLFGILNKFKRLYKRIENVIHTFQTAA